MTDSDPTFQPPPPPGPPRDPTVPPPAASPPPVPMTDRAWFVILIVFGAALFLGYPILWRTKAFRPATKVILSILVLVETVVLVALFCAAMWWSYHRIVEAL